LSKSKRDEGFGIVDMGLVAERHEGYQLGCWKGSLVSVCVSDGFFP